MPVSDYTPDVDAVAAYIRSRTKTRGGSEAGTFTSDSAPERDQTRPTAEQVSELITLTVNDISDTIGADVPAAHLGRAKTVAALGSAMLTELTYWQEQVNSGRSTYPQLKELYDEKWENLLTAMGIATDEGGGAVTADAGYPSYGGFPTTAIGMEQPF